MSREGYLPHGAGHEDTGEGCTLYCPRVFGVACESCTCDTPCEDSYDKTVEVEVLKHRTRKPDYECKPANIQVHKGDPE